MNDAEVALFVELDERSIAGHLAIFTATARVHWLAPTPPGNRHDYVSWCGFVARGSWDGAVVGQPTVDWDRPSSRADVTCRKCHRYMAQGRPRGWWVETTEGED